MEPEYAIKVSLTTHEHDNLEKPYYWSLIQYDKLWYQIASGWEESPQKCFSKAIEHYGKII